MPFAGIIRGKLGELHCNCIRFHLNFADLRCHQLVHVGNQLVVVEKHHGLGGIIPGGLLFLPHRLAHTPQGHPAQLGARVEMVVEYLEIPRQACLLLRDLSTLQPQAKGGFRQVKLLLWALRRRRCAGGCVWIVILPSATARYHKKRREHQQCYGAKVGYVHDVFLVCYPVVR